MSRFWQAGLIAALFFAGCSRGFTPPVPAGFTGGSGIESAAASVYHVLYSFAPSSGATPQSGLLFYNGTFFGTTVEGGAYLEGSV